MGCFAIGLGDSFYCYSDLGAMYNGRELGGGRFPFSPPPVEYPAGLGLVIWLASAVTSSAAGFIRVNMAMVAVASLATAWMLWRQQGRHAMLFAAAPSLALYAFLNWDMLAVVFAVAAIGAFLGRQNVSAGLLIGMGTAIKVFPGLLLLPMMSQRWREGDRPAAWRILIAAAVLILAVNAPVAWADFDGWAHFFHFNSTRVVDWGSLWSVGCQTFGLGVCSNLPLVNRLSLILFLASATITWLLVIRTAPRIPRWQLGFPLMVVFFLTNKVYSPQYSLFMLPWFALVLPDFSLFVAYQAIDVGIYAATFAWQERLAGEGGLPLWPLNVFIVLRAALLITMLVTWTRRAAAERPS